MHRNWGVEWVGVGRGEGRGRGRVMWGWWRGTAMGGGENIFFKYGPSMLLIFGNTGALS